MFRKALSIISLGAFIATSTVPAVAADFNQYSLTQNNSLDHFNSSSGATVGAYLQIPFSGGLKRSAAQPRFGLALSKNSSIYSKGFASSNAPKLLDLSYSYSGQDNFRFNGMSLADMRALNADDDGEKGGRNPWLVAGVTVSLVLGLLLLSACAEDEPFLNPCK